MDLAKVHKAVDQNGDFEITPSEIRSLGHDMLWAFQNCDSVDTDDDCARLDFNGDDTLNLFDLILGLDFTVRF